MTCKKSKNVAQNAVYIVI